MSKKNTLFSTAISGFKKSEVVEYIEEQNRKIKIEREASEYEKNSLLSDISSINEENASLKDKISQLEDNANELINVKNELETSLSENCLLKDEICLLKDDVATQREIISSMQQQNEDLLKKLADTEAENRRNAERAKLYDIDKLEAGGVLERAKAEAESIILSARVKAEALSENSIIEAQEKANALLKDSEKELAENMKKIKYLQKRRTDLLGAFARIKEAAGGFYDNVASVLLKDTEE